MPMVNKRRIIRENPKLSGTHQSAVIHHDLFRASRRGRITKKRGI
jgi:hypothetical protein